MVLGQHRRPSGASLQCAGPGDTVIFAGIASGATGMMDHRRASWSSRGGGDSAGDLLPWEFCASSEPVLPVNDVGSL